MASPWPARALMVGTVILFFLAVVWPAVAGVQLFQFGGEIPASFNGTRTLFTTVAWSMAAALGATILGWPVGRSIRAARGGAWMLALSVVAASLPAYAVFWTWWQATGPGSMLGDWSALHGYSEWLRTALLFVGLTSWGWPLAAWMVSMRVVESEQMEREIASVDGECRYDRFMRAWRSDRAALVLAYGALCVVFAGTTIAFDLAQVPTFGFELRTLDVQGTPAGAVMRAAWPAMIFAIIGAVIFSLIPIRPREDGAPIERGPMSPSAFMVILLTLLIPVTVLAFALLSRGALQNFVATSMRGAFGTVAVAAVSGALIGVVACGHLLMAARGASRGSHSQWIRSVEQLMLAGWTLAALVPATVSAVSLISAWNIQSVGWLVYDTPAVVVFCHLGRFGVVGAWIGRVIALREPRERRELRAVDGNDSRGVMQALAPELRGAWCVATLVATALAAGEVVASARVEPPGWAWSASTLLNAIHYQQPATVLGSMLALIFISGFAGLLIGVLAMRGERARNLALLIMVALILASCREETGAPSAAHIHAERWFGAPGRSRGQFEYPRAMDIDPRDGTVLVVDRQARVQRFSPSGAYLMEWSMPEKALGKPTGLGIGADGRVWVADTHYHRVICWSPEGKELFRFGEYGTGPGQFIYPCDVEIAADGNAWVAEFGGNDRIQIFSPKGEFIRSVGRNGHALGEFDRPQSIGFSANGQELCVADACNHRIQILDLQGAPLRSFGIAGSEPGQLVYPYGMEILADGTALITEFGNHRLQWIDLHNGNSLGCVRVVDGAPVPLVLHVVDGDRVRSVASGENALRFPWAVGVCGDEAFILDSGHSRVLVTKLESLRKPEIKADEAASLTPAVK